jgi:5-methylcytosine-specific restriction endonuclease McrA
MTTNKILAHHNRAARKLGLPGTLTRAQWEYTVNFFQGRCAYCLEQNYGVVEHFIPLSQGGGTTFQNCVPACQSCNVLKDNWHQPSTPARLRLLAALPRVQAYLATCESEVEP